MTNEDRARLERDAAHCVTHHNACPCHELAHLQEVERLRAQVAAMRPIVEALAASNVYESLVADNCQYCGDGWRMSHTPDCPVTLAREIIQPHDQ